VICNYDRTATPSLQPRYGLSAGKLMKGEVQHTIRNYRNGEPQQIVFQTVRTARMTTSTIRRSPGRPPASKLGHFSQTNGVTQPKDGSTQLLIRAKMQPIQYYQLFKKLEEVGARL
jgi:hypothetical protein